MKGKIIVSFFVLVATSLPLFAQSTTTDAPCAQRGFVYCRLPNIGENCNLGTCGASLSSSGNCTIEANYNADQSRISTCNVCSTESVDADKCRELGGTVIHS